MKIISTGKDKAGDKKGETSFSADTPRTGKLLNNPPRKNVSLPGAVEEELPGFSRQSDLLAPTELVGGLSKRGDRVSWRFQIRAIVAFVAIVLIGFGVSEFRRIREERRVIEILSMVQEGVPTDLIFDNVALHGDVSLQPFIRKRSDRPQIVDTFVKAPPQRKRTQQQLVAEVMRIISSTNKRQSDGRRLAMSIVAEGTRQQVDPLFVAAVIKSESAFNEGAVSNKGAQGLMQIMPATGRYLAKFHDLGEGSSTPRLKDAGLNLKLGVSYLKQLDGMYQGNRLLMLIAYNWGPGKLDRAIKSGRGVPAECLRYALKILRDHHLWQNNIA